MKLKQFRFEQFFEGSKPFIVVTLILGGFFVYNSLRIASLSKELGVLKQEINQTNSLLSEKIELFEKDVSALNQKIADVSHAAASADQTVQSRIGSFEQKVGEISDTLGTLEKLSKTDPELLQKYSKVYFLNEHYVPERLVEIGSEYRYSDRAPERIHEQVWPQLKKLLDAAKSESVPLYVKSAYRSFAEQKSLKSGYAITYGVGTANQFSADQGYSEHQLGTTVDFITTGLGGQLTGFDNTEAYQWLQNHAFQYGFTLSYPPNNNSYIFEPWHWRFVGVKLATYLHEQNKYFYDLDQREIDEYLVNIFD